MPQTTAINWTLIFLAILTITATTFTTNIPLFLNNKTQLSTNPHNVNLPW